MIISWVFSIFERHWFLKHTDRHTEQERNGQIRAHLAKSSSKSRLYVSQSKREGIVFQTSLREFPDGRGLRGSADLPFVWRIAGGTTSCFHKRHKMLETGETSWVQHGHPEVPRDHSLVVSVARKPRAGNKGCVAVLLGGDEHVVHIHTHAHIRVHTHTHTTFTQNFLCPPLPRL